MCKKRLNESSFLRCADTAKSHAALSEIQASFHHAPALCVEVIRIVNGLLIWWIPMLTSGIWNASADHQGYHQRLLYVSDLSQLLSWPVLHRRHPSCRPSDSAAQRCIFRSLLAK